MKATRKAGQYGKESVNVGTTDRWLSVMGGTALTYVGLKRESALGRAALSSLAGYLIYRGATGRCPAYRALGISTAREEKHGITVEKKIRVNAPHEEVYRYWHDFENLPRFMDHLESVEVFDVKKSRWVARTPGGIRLEWNSEMTEDIPNEYIAWRSLPGSDFENEGSVSFKRGRTGNDTELNFRMTYYPPAGLAGAALGELFKAVTSQKIGQNLERFKEIMETAAEAEVGA